MKEEIYKRIEAYLGGDMPPEEIVLFEKELEENDALKKELDLYNKLNYHLGNKIIDDKLPDNLYTKELNEFLVSEEANQIKKNLEDAKNKYLVKKPSSKSKIYVRLAAAVILLLIISRIGFQLINTPASLFNDYYNPNDLPSLVKRNDSQSNLYEGIIAFNNKKYDEAITDFEAYKRSEKEINTLMFLYQGMSYLELDENDKAIEAFKIVSTSNILDSSRGLWFEALVYLKAKDDLNAKKILEKIRSNSSNFKFKEAKELLDKLK